MTSEPIARDVSSDIPILVTEDVACRKCSYNLRGLFGDGRCPECGTPVGISLRGDLLRFADPEWVKRLALGIRYIFLGILVTIVLAFAGGIALARQSPLLTQMIPVIAGLVGYYGVWLLTEPDPSGLGEDTSVSARKFIRLALFFGIISQIATGILQSANLQEWMQYLALIIMGLSGLIGVAGEFAKFTYFRTLARRLPDEKLVKRANLLRWGYVMPTAFFLIVMVITFMGLSKAGAGGPGVIFGGGVAGAAGGGASPFAGGAFIFFGCGSALFGIAFLIFGLMALQLMWTLGKRFKEQAELARINWADVQSEPRR